MQILKIVRFKKLIARSLNLIVQRELHVIYHNPLLATSIDSIF